MGKAEEGFTAQHESCGVHDIQIQAEGTEFPDEVWQVQKVKVPTVKLGSDVSELTAHAHKTLGIWNEEEAGKLKDSIKFRETKEKKSIGRFLRQLTGPRKGHGVQEDDP